MTRIASQLPPGLTCYRTTPEFNRESVPAALLGAHSTKAGVWGLLRVLRGRIRYCLDSLDNETRVVAAGDTAVIEPETPHHVEMLDADTAFRIEFHRAAVRP